MDKRDLYKTLALEERLSYLGQDVCPYCQEPLPRGAEYRRDRTAIEYTVGMPAAHRDCITEAVHG